MVVWRWILNTLLWGIIIPVIVFTNPSQANAPNHHQWAIHAHNTNNLVWNVQGVGSKEFRNILREHIHMHKPSIVALVETRISGKKAQLTCDKIGFRNCFRVEAKGF